MSCYSLIMSSLWYSIGFVSDRAEFKCYHELLLLMSVCYGVILWFPQTSAWDIGIITGKIDKH